MQIPIVNGIYTDQSSNFRIKYPLNMEPVAQSNGISAGFLRPAHGIISYGLGPGRDRGAINWNDISYRAMGDKLVKVETDGTVTTLATIPGSDQVTFDYSFDRLGIAAQNKLFYWDDVSLFQVTDTDLGNVIDMIWVDGFFMTTDGEFIVVTDINDPTSVNPLKYGSSEADPDPILALLKLRNEPYALNRYTIESFSNIGGSGFPFQRIEGAQIQRGCVGTHACHVFMEAIAFVGGGRNEPNSVWLALAGKSVKLATREIDEVLQDYTESELSKAVCEVHTEKGVEQLIIRLKDQTLVYDGEASKQLGEPVWYTLSSGIDAEIPEEYRATNRVWANDRWIVGDTESNNVGFLTNTISSHWGNEVTWEFGTTMIYNESRGAIFHELELVGLPGRVAVNDNESIFTSYSIDGQIWSQEKSVSGGKQGQRDARLVWFRQGTMGNYRMQKFRGSSKIHASFARLEIRLEPLAV